LLKVLEEFEVANQTKWLLEEVNNFERELQEIASRVDKILKPA
jgi:hypothetical protein